ASHPRRRADRRQPEGQVPGRQPPDLETALPLHASHRLANACTPAALEAFRAESATRSGRASLMTSPHDRTRLIAGTTRKGQGRRGVNPPVERASTMLSDRVADMHDAADGPVYGLAGTSAARA